MVDIPIIEGGLSEYIPFFLNFGCIVEQDFLVGTPNSNMHTGFLFSTRNMFKVDPSHTSTGK